MKKSINGNVVSILSGVGDWKRVSGRKASAVDWTEFTQEKYLFTHVTICCSVAVEDSNGYYIKPETSKLVNDNGNAWTNQVLLATFRTFKGAYNFQEHVQIPEESKGTILDAAVRPVDFDGVSVLFCDILVATDRKHRKLVSDIESGKMNTMSMGCNLTHGTCSKCGHCYLDGQEEPCSHIKNDLLSTFIDENGVERIVAELCGRMTLVDGKWVADENSVDFIEGSWVETPAFRGAVVGYRIENLSDEKKSEINDLRSLEASFDLGFSRVANKKNGIEDKVFRRIYENSVEGRVFNRVFKK